MDKHQKYTAALLAVLVLGTAWLKWRGHPNLADQPASNDAADVSPFLAPFGWSTPGIDDNPLILNGGPPFSSVVNVNVNPSYLGTLSQQYIPMFGFVGMDAGMGLAYAANSSNQSLGRIAAPPPLPPAPPMQSTVATSASPFNQPSPVIPRKVLMTNG